jgi:hypothetical protein
MRSSVGAAAARTAIAAFLRNEYSRVILVKTAIPEKNSTEKNSTKGMIKNGIGMECGFVKIKNRGKEIKSAGKKFRGYCVSKFISFLRIKTTAKNGVTLLKNIGSQDGKSAQSSLIALTVQSFD